MLYYICTYNISTYMRFFDKLFIQKTDSVDNTSQQEDVLNIDQSSESPIETLSLEELIKLKPPYITELISDYGIMKLPNLLKTAEIDTALSQIEQQSSSAEPNSKELDVVSDMIFEITLPASENTIKKFLSNYYKDQFDFDKLVSQQQQNRNITKKQATNGLLATIESMSSDIFIKFQNRIQKELSEHSYTNDEASEFIYWRLNALDSGLILEISKTSSEEDERLLCLSFVNEAAMIDFQESSLTQNESLYTSEHIDSMGLN
ncbi:MAG: hypothetical protein ACKUBY_02315 [Candidatus Moraniibacteriota bacterium]